MKKIERIQIEPVIIKGKEAEGCIVHEADLAAQEAYIKQLEENQKWISVEDILPEHEEAVDIYHKDLCRVPDCIYIDPSNYDGVGEKHFFTGKICIYLEDVTHWRKIPDNPPQEKE